MRAWTVTMLTAGLVLAAGATEAQPPGGGKKGGPPKGGDGGGDLVARMMAFDADKDGKLSKDEVTDDRLHRLFDRADADKDGAVTKDELTALAAKLAAEVPQGRGGPPGGPGGFGPPGGRGMGGPPQPGQVLPGFLQEMLGLTADQRKQVADLQKEVDAKLDKILTADQKRQLRETRDRGPGGPPGGRGRNGPPPGERPE